MARVAAGAGIAEISGVYGPSIISNSRQGMVLRRKPVYKRPTSPYQAAASARIKQAAQAWAELDWPVVEAWNDFASRIQRTNPVNGKRYSPSGYTTFIGLATKVLQVDPSSPIPPLPPAGVFMGDDILISAAPPHAARGKFTARDERADRGSDTEAPDDDSPSAQRPSSSRRSPSLREGESATIVFSSSGPNSPGTVTELLLQKLVNIRRAAGVQYKSVAFVVFGTEVMVPVEPGAYVPAYQFVEAATGRATGLIVLPRIEVE